MLQGRPSGPLSPPTSPRMSDLAATAHKDQWRITQNPPLDVSESTESPLVGSLVLDRAQQQPTAETSYTRPPLRSHKSFPYSLGTSDIIQNDIDQQMQPGEHEVDALHRRVYLQGLQPIASADILQPIYGGSAPTSPAERLTPQSPDDDIQDTLMEDEEVDLDTEVPLGEGGRPMTAAELRAHKRKMKRFRLTHNQTRFLMSEFARQAHPDAAHRERLSREIPGLSPRQVQVWFQNRRAKLKRLTTDDRERMMRSRALPAGFDMTQALHAPFGASSPSVTTPVEKTENVSTAGTTGGPRPLTLDTFTQHSAYNPYHNQYGHQTGITPAMGAFAFTPPQSATETISPGSAASNMSAFSFQTQESPRRQPLGAVVGHPSAYPVNPSAYPAHRPPMPRLNTHDRLIRPMGETAGSPLRTSMSYSGLHSINMQHAQMQGRRQSLSQEGQHASRHVSNPSMVGSGPYGLGFTYPHMSSFQQMEQAPQSSTAKVVAPRYRRSSSNLAGPPLGLSQYPSANYTAPQLQQYSQFGGHFQPQYLQQSFPRALHNYQSPVPQPVSHPGHTSFSPAITQPDQFNMPPTRQETDLGDNSDGGVPLPPSY